MKTLTDNQRLALYENMIWYFENGGKWGFCQALVNALYWTDIKVKYNPYSVGIETFLPELKPYRPPIVEDDYWFPLHMEGRQHRINILKEIITTLKEQL